jgi:hypothetical protein
VRDFAAAAEIDPEAPRRARALLPGRPVSE